MLQLHLLADKLECVDKDRRLPDFANDFYFERGYSADFQEGIVLKALNHLWGGNFTEDALCAGYTFSKSVPMWNGDGQQSWCTLDLQTIQDPDDEDDLITVMDLTVATNKEEVLDDLRKGYIAERFEALQKLGKPPNRRKKRRLVREIANTNLTAKECTTYSFSALAGDGFRVAKRLELWEGDSADARRWSTESFIWEDDQVEDDIRGNAEAAYLDDEFESDITPEDFFLIMDAFKSLGVPESVFTGSQDNT